MLHFRIKEIPPRLNRLCNRLALALAFLIAGACGFSPVLAAEWKPDRNIEIIVPTGPGSGVDNTARTLQAILLQGKLVEQSISVTNKAGGSYGVGLNYLGQYPGDGHRLFIQTSTPLSALLTGQLK